MKFLLFGTGDYYQRYKKWFAREEIVALLDNSAYKQNTIIDGYRVLAPEEGIELSYDAIIILSFYFKDMKEQLISLGVLSEQIYHFYDLNSILNWKKMARPVQYYRITAEEIRAKEKRRILLLSQELTLGGPPIALLHAAEILKANGCEVVYASMIDGPLREKLERSGIPVIVDENIQVATMQDINWTKYFSLIICNTINFHIFLTKRNMNIPIVWWLHDAPFFYDGIRQENLERINDKNMAIVSVGPVPMNAMRRYLPSVSIGRLLYGVEDVAILGSDSIDDDRKITFVTIGFWENIKGQDILLRAIELLPNEIKNAIQVLFVGHDSTLFAEELKGKHKSLAGIQYLGSVDREQIHNILSRADVLVCPSRQDSMPTVVAEAMMHSVPCIVSDAIGTVEYIESGKDGLIFRSEDVKALSDKIEWCVKHKPEIALMGNNSRKIYEEVFSMKAFERDLLSVVEKFI